MKKARMLICGLIVGLVVHSQTVDQEVEKQIRDPQRKANAGKADVIIVDKKKIFDSTTFNNKADDAGNRKPVKAGANKKSCGSKRGKSNTRVASKST